MKYLPALLLCLGSGAQAQQASVLQSGERQHANIEQIDAANSRLNLRMQGSDNGVFITQVGASHRAVVLLDGAQLGEPAGAGRIAQQGEGQQLQLRVQGERIAFDVQQQGAAGNHVDAALRGEDLLLEVAQQSFSPLAPQLLSLNMQGSGHSAEISQTASERAREGNRISLSQTGSGHSASLSQRGAGNVIEASQQGRGNRLQIEQFGDGNHAEVQQQGSAVNAPTITQTGGAQLRITHTGY